MALWKARGGSLNKELDFRLWHSGWQGNGSLNGIVEGKGVEVQIKSF